MAGDLDQIIGDSLIDAGLAETSDHGELVPTEEEETPSPAETQEEGEEEESHAGERQEAAEESDTPEEKLQKADATERVENQLDDLDKELEGLGVKGRDKKGQETLIRYRRIRKIWENYKGKHKDEVLGPVQKELDQIKKDLQQASTRLSDYDNTNRLIKSDPITYLRLLARAQPDVARYLRLEGEAQGGGSEKPAEDWKIPPPDGKFGDGTQGYTPEGLQNILLSFGDHITKKVTSDLTGRFQKDYGTPIARITQQEQENIVRRQAESRVRANFEQAKRVYGDIFVKDFGEVGNIKKDSKVMQVLREHTDPQTGRSSISFSDACAIALIPIINASRVEAQQEHHEELRESKRAARSSVPARETVSRDVTPKTTEDIIMQEMIKAGMV